MNALATCLEWADTGNRGFLSTRHEYPGVPPFYAVQIWVHYPGCSAIGHGPTREDAAREALANATARGMIVAETGALRGGLGS